jgi:signal transduction histidine kinase
MVNTGGDVIVLWASKESPDTFVWMANAPPGVRVAFVAPDSMATAVPAALARGAVIAVVDGDRDAYRALALGVDEVVRAKEASASALSVASERARLRAIGRDARPSRPEGDPRSIELLAASVGSRLANPLAVASLNVEILRAAVEAVAKLADAYAHDAATGRELPGSEAERVVALRASAPPTPDLKATVHDLAAAVHEATTAVTHVYSLLSADGLDGECDLALVVAELAELVRVVVERVAEFRVELPEIGSCPSPVPRSVVIHGLSALLMNAVQAVRDRQERGTITVRIEMRASAAVLEVTDTGVGVGPSVRMRALQPFFSTRGEAGLGLSNVAERIRAHGGEIVLESEPGVGTTVRLFVPLQARTPFPETGTN